MNFTLAVSVSEAQTIMDALGNMPYTQVAALYQRLAMQLQEQQRQQQNPVPPGLRAVEEGAS